MFAKKLTDITIADIQTLFSAGIAEGSDIEFKRELPAKNPPDLWMTGGKLGDFAKDQLAAELIAFANTDGATLPARLGACRRLAKVRRRPNGS